ncbi:beta-lactamase family protein [Thalassomonas viridans]|uniref:Beta-lactamase family protein n=1 Tax=Thalassomonas viridans TaxID=137584 RepID=A0AAF0C7B8_9GAMM|nr:serine hydrolase domain-containing protein [Thalassomonas viridans]WDE03181.1 beta-lactamase family protein [Thalassomonas viridans]
MRSSIFAALFLLIPAQVNGQQATQAAVSGQALPSLPLPPSPEQQDLLQAFENFLLAEVAPKTPGFAVALVLGGEAKLLKGYGVANAGSEEKVDADTVFRLASVSKTFTSAAVGTLVAQDKVSWDSKLSDYVADLSFNKPEYGSALTVRHLLSHTSGLMPHAYTNLIEDRVSYRKILTKMEQVPFICAPGKCYAYQNVVYSLAGDMVEAISKQSFEQVVQDNLFTPLNMKNASYGLKAFVGNENRAQPHKWNRRQEKWRPVKVNNNYYRVAPAAGINASITDMKFWLMAQLGKHQAVLNDDILDEMHGKHIKTSARQGHYRKRDWQNLGQTYYGLGWRVFDYNGRENFVHHGGWVDGTRTEMVFNEALQMGLVFLTNSETRMANKIVPTFLRLYSQMENGELAANTGQQPERQSQAQVE